MMVITLCSFSVATAARVEMNMSGLDEKLSFEFNDIRLVRYYVITIANEPPAAPATAWMSESLDMIQRFCVLSIIRQRRESSSLKPHNNHGPGMQMPNARDERGYRHSSLSCQLS